MIPPPSEYLSTGEVARMLAVDRATVARWVRERKLRARVSIPGAANHGAYGFAVADVVAAMAAGLADGAESATTATAPGIE